MADRIVSFFEEESSFGGSDGTVVDAILGDVDFEADDGAGAVEETDES
jgi:hypothetical protein